MTGREKITLTAVWVLLGGGALFGALVTIDALTPSIGYGRRPPASAGPDWRQLAIGIVIALGCGVFAYAQTAEIIEQARRQEWKWACPACGYDLRSNPNRCPECGAVTPEDIGRRAHRRLNRTRDSAQGSQTPPPIQENEKRQ